MKESLLDVFKASTRGLQDDESLETILQDSEALLDQMKQARLALLNRKEDQSIDNKMASSEIKNLQIKADYFNSQTLKHEKVLNKKIKSYSNKIDTVNAKGVTMDSIYPFKLAGVNNNKSHESNILNLAILLDLLYQGQFDLIDKLSPHLNFNEFLNVNHMSPDLQLLFEAFKPLILISSELDNGNYDPLLNWTGKNITEIESIDPLFEFDLVTCYSCSILSQPNKELQLPINFDEDIPLVQNLTSKWYYQSYQELLNQNKSITIRELKFKFQRMYSLISDKLKSFGKIPNESPLKATLTVAHVALNDFVRYCQLQKIRPRSSITTHSQDAKYLPFEVELPSWLNHHSIFICPVSREETSKNDPPIYMPCGHMVSADTMRKLSRNSTRNFKCPYCPQNMTARQCVEVDIIDLY